MGLTIHYSLGFPAKTVQQARQAVERLRQRCLDLPFAEVGALQSLEGKACDFTRCRRDDPDRWLIIQSRGSINCVSGAGGRYRAVGEDENWNSTLDLIPRAVVAFTAWPGEGCEEANFGLRLLPARLQVHTTSGEPYWLAAAKRDRGWTWDSFCKTQYANNPRCGGVQHFLLCHLTVIAVLDAARQFGFSVEVSDEGGFWADRSVEALAKEVGSWDQHLAALVGALKDQAATQGMTVEAPITERPDFEHLEAAGALNPKLRRLIETIVGAGSQQASPNTGSAQGATRSSVVAA